MNSTEVSHDSDAGRRARLRRRLVGGVFTALFAVQWCQARVASADAVRPQSDSDKAVAPIQARVDEVCAVLEAGAIEDGAGFGAWDNHHHWNNHWHNWDNHWHNWDNHWSNHHHH